MSVRAMVVVAMVASLVGVLTVFSISPIFADGPETDPAMAKLKEQVNVMSDALEVIRQGCADSTLTLLACLQEIEDERKAEAERIARIEAELAGVKDEVGLLSRIKDFFGGLMGRIPFLGIEYVESPLSHPLAEGSIKLETPSYLEVDPAIYSDISPTLEQRMARIEEQVEDIRNNHNRLVSYVTDMTQIMNNHGHRLANISKAVNFLLGLFDFNAPAAPDLDTHNT